MKLFSVGLRSGSSSLAVALRQLGYPRVYSMGVTVQRHSHLRAWRRHAAGKQPLDFNQLLGPWDATKAHPAMFYPEQVLAAFPDVKVILLQRDDEAWFDSYSRLYRVITGIGHWLCFLPRCRAFHGTFAEITVAALGPGLPQHRAEVIAARHALHDRVRALVPPHRLLEFDVSDGWGPLCEFLGAPLPEGPFPWINRGQSAVKKAVSRALLRDLAWVGAGASVLALLGPTPAGLGLLACELALFMLLFRLGKV